MGHKDFFETLFQSIGAEGGPDTHEPGTIKNKYPDNLCRLDIAKAVSIADDDWDKFDHLNKHLKEKQI